MTYDARTLWRHAWRVARTAARNGTPMLDVCDSVPELPMAVAQRRLRTRTSGDPVFFGATARTRRAALIMDSRESVHRSAEYRALCRMSVREMFREALPDARPRID